jgi:hypothetical protein
VGARKFLGREFAMRIKPDFYWPDRCICGGLIRVERTFKGKGKDRRLYQVVHECTRCGDWEVNPTWPGDFATLVKVRAEAGLPVLS